MMTEAEKKARAVVKTILQHSPELEKITIDGFEFTIVDGRIKDEAAIEEEKRIARLKEQERRNDILKRVESMATAYGDISEIVTEGVTVRRENGGFRLVDEWD